MGWRRAWLAPVLVLLLVLAMALAGCGATGAATTTTTAPTQPVPAKVQGPIDSATLRQRVGLPGLRRHLDELARIAAANGDTRVAGSAGDRATIAYVTAQLRAAGYRPTTERVTGFDDGGASTSNVIAELAGSRPDRVVMVGAHLDSVPAGPGINDNGSGIATVLELARNMAGSQPVPTVRFAFWGAEEEGLVGSSQYVGGLDDAAARRIALYLNLDMIASPNFARLVYDPGGAPPGSEAVAAELLGYFKRAHVTAETIDFPSRSDHAPFRERGIPVGGLFSGAEEAKTPAQAAADGGQAGAPFDSCYHRACDTLDHLGATSLDQLADAAADALATFGAGTLAIDRERAAAG